MKQEVVFYSAVSVDGYIATDNQEASVAWLDAFNQNIVELSQGDKIRNSYSNFISDVKTIICGSKTYQDILGFGVDWPYAGYDTYIVTNKAHSYKDDNIKAFIGYQDILQIIEQSEGKVYILGGGNLAGQLIDDEVITKLILTQMPILLGKGVRYFQNNDQKNLQLVRIDRSQSFIEIEYNIIKNK